MVIVVSAYIILNITLFIITDHTVVEIISWQIFHGYDNDNYRSVDSDEADRNNTITISVIIIPFVLLLLSSSLSDYLTRR